MFSKEDKLITVYSYDKDTKEYLGSFEYFWAKDTGLAAGATLEQPPQPDSGQCVIFDADSQTWQLTEDHFGKVAYSIVDKSEIKIDYYGPVRGGFTLLKPERYDTWTGAAWEDLRTDAEKREAYLQTFPNLSKRQFNLYMFDSGLKAEVDALLAADPRTQLEFDSVTTISRTNPTVEAMIVTLGWTDDEVEQMWTQASKL